MAIVLDAFIAISDAESFSSICLQVALYYHPLKSFIGYIVHPDELSLFPPSWASQVQTCLILMSLPIPIKTLSESLLPSLCQSLSLSLSLYRSDPPPTQQIFDGEIKPAQVCLPVTHVWRWQWLCKDGVVKVSSGQYTPAVTNQ